MNVAEFREDLKTMTLNECLKKHNVDLNTAFKLSTPKPIQKRKKTLKDKSLKFLTKQGGRYALRKKIKGVNYNFGSYPILEEAKIVRDCMVECNWDKTQLERIIKENNIQTLPPNARVNPMSYIRKTKHGTYLIVKYFGKHDEHMRYNGFGTYKTLKEAQAIRDELIQVNWDKSKLEEIKNKLNIVDSCGR